MPYKTGDLAKMVGLTSQTLREYENYGLLEADKDSLTGYRSFSSQMVSKAIAIRSLRNLSFSLPEVKILLDKMDYDDYCVYFENVLERQLQKLEQQKMICELAKEQAISICQIQEIYHKCSLLENVSFYCLDYLKGETPLLKGNHDFSVMKTWADKSMFTRNYSPLTSDAPGDQIMGLAIEKQKAVQLELPLESPVYVRKADFMLEMMVRHSTMNLPEPSEFQYLFDYAQNNHLTVLDGGFIVSRFSYWENEEEISYSMLYYPVEKA